MSENFTTNCCLPTESSTLLLPTNCSTQTRKRRSFQKSTVVWNTDMCYEKLLLIVDKWKKKKTLHCTLFDLANVFGSVNHYWSSIPSNGIIYLNVCQRISLIMYSRLSGVITGPSWTTTKFPFRTGTFHGDPLSPEICSLVFNPIVQYLKLVEDCCGYKLNGNSVIRCHMQTTST